VKDSSILQSQANLLRIAGNVIIIGAIVVGGTFLILGLSPYWMGSVGNPLYDKAPKELLAGAGACLAFISSGVGIAIGVDFLTRGAMLQTYINIEANTREVADLLKRRPNA